jgi:hypothetical protein
MKNTKIPERMNISWIGITLCGALLMAASGCICINVSPPCTGMVCPRSSTSPQSTGRNDSNRATPAGGNFVPVHNTLATGSSTTVCDHPVKLKYVRFSFDDGNQSLLTQTPDLAVDGFQGYVEDAFNGVTNTLSTTHYYLQWLVNGLPQNNGCATNVNNSTTDVGFTVTCEALPHRFTAFFKTGTQNPHPIAGHVYRLKGAWTTQ